MPAPRSDPFYGVIGVSIVIVQIVDHLPIDPMKTLIWSAALNGVLVVPAIGAMLVVASRRTATPWQLCLGWLTCGLMLAAAVAMAEVVWLGEDPGYNTKL